MNQTVLIIEDDEKTAQSLSDFVKSLKDDAIVARNMAEAEGITRQFEFDALILDLMLPCVRGVQSFHRAKATAPYSPIIVLSGYIGIGGEFDVQKLIELGAVAALPKPATIDQLQDALNVARLQRELILTGSAVNTAMQRLREVK